MRAEPFTSPAGGGTARGGGEVLAGGVGEGEGVVEAAELPGARDVGDKDGAGMHVVVRQAAARVQEAEHVEEGVEAEHALGGGQRG